MPRFRWRAISLCRRRQKLETLTKQLQEANRQLRVERRRERKKQLDQNDSNDSSDLGRHRSRLSEVIQQLQTGKRALRNEDVALAEQQFSAALDMIAADESKGVNEPNYVYAVERRKALRGLGAAKRLVGDTRAALQYYSRVLEVSETVGDHHGDADVCGTLADLYAELNDFDNAAVYYDRLISCMTNQEYYTEDVSSDAAAEDVEVEVETRL